jgi:hypothetical protein
MKPLFTSDYKRTLLVAYAGWWSTVAIVALRATDMIPQSAGSVALLTLGLGVTASLALSRMKLSSTVSQVFQTGLSVAVSLNSGNGNGGNYGTAVVRTNLEGVIDSIENPGVIGWADDQSELMIGKRLDDFIPDRFLRINHAALLSYREAGAGGTDESAVVIAFNLPILGGDGVERAFRMTIARLGDTLIKTLVPLSEKLPETYN